MDDHQDLVVVALSGVQRFIEESRSTSDLRSGSQIIVELTAQAVSVFEESAAELVFPASAREKVGMPNRVVALAPAGQGAELAKRAVERVHAHWKEWLREFLGREEDTPGMPSVMWVVAPPREGGYPEQWKEAQRRLAARKQVRNFTALEARSTGLCLLSPRWPATGLPSKDLRPFERDMLSAANWVKREHGRRREGIASTYAIASAPFRAAVLEKMNDDAAVAKHVKDLREAVKTAEIGLPGWPLRGMAEPQDDTAKWLWRHGGQWVYPDSWSAESLARQFGKPASGEEFDLFRIAVGVGLIAATRLQKAMLENHKVAPPASYLAILTQDLDNMGRHLSDPDVLSRKGHAEISDQLREVAEKQTALLHSPELLGATAYAGGDDLLAFLPAATALEGARACKQAVVEVSPSLPTASTALLFFHRKYPLRLALAEARKALAAAKSMPEKHALAVGYLRRSGTQETYVRKWTPDRSAPDRLVTDCLAVFARSGPQEAQLSPGLLRDLERDGPALGRLRPDTLVAELRRLVHRHTSAPTAEQQKEFALQATDQLRVLGLPDSSSSANPEQPLIAAARVAVFLRQECR